MQKSLLLFVIVLAMLLGHSGDILAQTFTPKGQKLKKEFVKYIENSHFDSAFILTTNFLQQPVLSPADQFTGHFFLGYTYNLLGKKKQGISEIKKALACSGNHTDGLNRYVAYQAIADIYFTAQQFDSAGFFAEKAKVYLPENEPVYLANNAIILGYCAYLKNDYKNAFAAYRKAIKGYETAGDRCALPLVYSKIAKVFYYTGNKASALQYLKRGIHLVDSCGSKELLLLCKLTQLEFFEKDKQYEKAFVCLKEINTLNEEIDKRGQAAQINKLEVEYRTRLKELENKELKQLNAKKGKVIATRRWELVAAVLAIELFIIFTILLIRSSRRLKGTFRSLEEQKQKIEFQNQQLERLNILNQKIFSVIAHDFKGPILSLQLVLQSLENKEHNAETIRIFTSGLNHQLVQSSQMLTSLLDWAKIELNIGVREYGTCNAFQISDEITKQLQNAVTAKALSIINNIPYTLEVNVPPDIMLILFRNMISNAIKFSYTNTAIELDYDVQCNAINIRDEGVGIPDDKLDRLFKTEVNPGIGTGNETGFGFGLYMCYELLQRYNGKLSAEKIKGGGTCFTIELPR